MKKNLLVGSALCLILGLIGCTDAGKNAQSKSDEKNKSLAAKKAPVSQAEESKDKSLEIAIKYFETADSIHREAWWVLSEQKMPMGKSSFGKVQRALISSQNIKLSNKSLFRCDRYMIRRDIKGLNAYPQNITVLEKCSEKEEARKLADLVLPKEGEIQVRLFPAALEEVLGKGAAFLNREVTCVLRGTEKGLLTELSCQNWAQDRSSTQMVRLDQYDYKKDKKNMIRLRGKVFENLTELRKIEADIPLEGKITVTETELYAPEAELPSAPVPSPAVAAPVSPSPPSGGFPGGVTPIGQGGGAVQAPPTRGGVPPMHLDAGALEGYPDQQWGEPMETPAMPPQVPPQEMPVQMDENGNFIIPQEDQGYMEEPTHDNYEVMEHGAPVMTPRGEESHGR